MKAVDPSGAPRVTVNEASFLARYADYQSRSRNRLILAMGDGRSKPSLFVGDEVLADGNDKDLVDELMGDYGAEIIPEPPFAAAPFELRQHRRADIDPATLPRCTRLRFAKPPSVEHPTRLLEESFARASYDNLTITSGSAAAVGALLARFAADRPSIGLNFVGEGLAMPLSTAGEAHVSGNQPFLWPAFTGRTRMVEAWQLIDSIRQVRGDRFVTIGILDSGFWLDNIGRPMIAAGQIESDFGAGVMQLNLQNEGQPAGGMNPILCSGDNPCAWHGNGVASAAAATVNNAAGAAGSGGTVARPFFIRSDLSEWQVMRGVTYCALWGIDVLNMSFGISDMGFPETTYWEKFFQFSFDNNVVMIVAAGNDSTELPDGDGAENVRPATRTPGVLTVGALDLADNARPSSNFGSSVWLWAPGTNIPVAPDGNPLNQNGSVVSGTSIAAPIVSGVAAMMRFANGALSAAEIITILVETGWNGTGHVSKGLDAYAAVFRAIHQTLPDYSEPNNTPATAKPLFPTTPGGPMTAGFGGFTARSTAGDQDYWKFQLDRYSMVTVSIDWYERLGSLTLSLEAEDPEAPGPGEMIRSGNPASGNQLLSGLLAPGTYRVRVGGSGVTAYRLIVTPKPSRLPRDDFEYNDSFESAADLVFEAHKWSPVSRRQWGPGTFDATLHQERSLFPEIGCFGEVVTNDDYFRLKVPASSGLRRPIVTVSNADFPLNVSLYDETRSLIRTWPGVRFVSVQPPQNSIRYLSVSGDRPTRYKFSTRVGIDPRDVPDRPQVKVTVLPEWWGDPPPLHLDEPITHYIVDVDTGPSRGGDITFELPATDVNVELIDASGQEVRESEILDNRLVVNTNGLGRGEYLMRISRGGNGESPSAVELRLVPPVPWARLQADSAETIEH